MIRNIKQATTQKIVNLALEPAKESRIKNIRANYNTYRSMDDLKKKLPQQTKEVKRFAYSDELEPVKYDAWVFDD